MNPRFSLFFAGLVVSLLPILGGCAKREAAPPPAPSTVSGDPAARAADATPSADRARIVTVTMNVRVTNLVDATDRARRDVETAGGYVEGSTLSASDDGSATMDLRVPAEQASATRTHLRAMGHVASESETVQDVTEQRADLGARLHAARTQENRLLEIMKNKTGTIGDVLVSEKELARVRENVEKLEAEQRTMDAQVAMATIHLTLTTPSSSAWQTPGQSVGHAWHAGVRAAEAIAVFGAMAVAALAPTLVPVLLFLGLVLFLLRRSRAKKTAALLAG